MRSYLLIVLALAVLVYAAGVLVYLQSGAELGIRCLLRRANEQGPQIAVDESIEFEGHHPRNGDRLLTLAGTPVPTFVHFNRRVTEIQRQANEAPIRVLADRDQLAGGQDLPPIVRVDGSCWVRIEFLPDEPAATPQFAWLKLRPVPLSALVVSLVWFVLELVILAIGAAVVWRRPGDASATIFYLLCAIQVVAFIGGFHWPRLVESRLLLYPFVCCVVLLAPLLLHFHLLFPRPVPGIRRWPWVVALVYALPAIWMVLLFGHLLEIDRLYGEQEPTGALAGELDALAWQIYGYLAVSVAMFLVGQAVLVRSYLRSRTLAERNQVRWLLAAFFLAAVPVGWLLYAATYEPAEFIVGTRSKWMMYLTSVSFALGYAVSITRYKLVHIRWINRGILYFAISFAATALFCLLVGIGTALVGTYYFRWENALAAGVTSVVVVVVLGWIRDRLQRAIDRRFRRQRHQLDRALEQLGRAVDELVEPGQLARQLLESARDALRATRGAVYLRDGQRGPLRLAASTGWPEMPEELALPAEQTAESAGNPMDTHNRPGLPDALSAAAEEPLAGGLTVPLEVEGEVVGLLMVMAKHDQAPFTSEERAFLAALARTASLSLRSARGHRTIEMLRHELQDKLRKIAEQQQRIVLLQAELLGREGQNEQTEPGLAARATPGKKLSTSGMRGSSAAIRRLLADGIKVAGSCSSILIRGESGTGKELLARAIHQASPRAGGPFVAVHCAALSAGLLESELFGHVRGAFTGADRDKVGRFELAEGGTLFLDEIGDINLETQTKLLRVLQEKSFERVGGTRPIRVDVRLMAATHQNLETLIRQGRFREDLFYRINVISLWCPPLRERPEDIFELALHFVERYAREAGKAMWRIEEDAVDALASYPWPGNVRQLENVIQRAVVLADGPTIRLQDLPPELLGPSSLRSRSAGPAVSRLPTAQPARSVVELEAPLGERLPAAGLEVELDGIERERILDALRRADGNKAQAARLLGIPRSTLVSKLRKFGLN